MSRANDDSAWNETFLDSSDIPSVQRLAAALNAADCPPAARLRKMIAFAVSAISTQELGDELAEALRSNEGLFVIFSGTYDLLQAAVRNAVPDKLVKRQLGTMGIRGPFASDLCSALTASRDELTTVLAEQRIALPHITEVNWRVDVTISTAAMSRVFKPSITMRLTTSTGDIRTFEVDPEQFHSLRYGVAKVLKSMCDLAEHPMLARS